jgi:predicted RNase H-like HicB family nuclease
MVRIMRTKKLQKINTFTAVFQKVRGGYTTWVEEMPNVISEGKTKVMAERNLKDALELMLETNRIMSFKDAVGNIERSTISFAVQSVA